MFVLHLEYHQQVSDLTWLDGIFRIETSNSFQFHTSRFDSTSQEGSLRISSFLAPLMLLKILKYYLSVLQPLKISKDLSILLKLLILFNASTHVLEYTK